MILSAGSERLLRAAHQVPHVIEAELLTWILRCHGHRDHMLTGSCWSMSSEKRASQHWFQLGLEFQRSNGMVHVVYGRME